MPDQQKPFFVRVRIFDATKDATPEQTRVIDYSKPKDRAWLAKVSWWGLLNHKAVETVNVIDDDEEELSKAA